MSYTGGSTRRRRLAASIARAALERGAALAAVAALIALTALSGAALAAPSAASGVVDVVAAIGDHDSATAGSGLVVSSQGEVLTNNHVIRGATSLTVSDPQTGRSYAATVVGYDVLADVAVLRLRGASRLPTVRLAAAAAEPGDAVTAIGNAAGRGGAPQSTSGTVLALDRSLRVTDDHGEVEELHGLIQASAQIHPGDSGGPLVNREGQVIGMDTATATPSHARGAAGQASFAIPIDVVLAVARRIESGRRSSSVHIGPTPFIGVDVQLPAPGAARTSGRGALVARVVASSPAQRAGLGKGDRITTLDGHPIESFNTIAGVVVGLAPGTTIAIGWLSPSGALHWARLRLASGPPQ